jgi:hypothetical protein
MENLTLNQSFRKIKKAPSNQLLWAVLTLFFFLPLGVIAIINSIKIDNLWANGFYDEAKQAAFFVKIITIIGMTVGVVTYLSLALILGSIYFMAV